MFIFSIAKKLAAGFIPIHFVKVLHREKPKYKTSRDRKKRGGGFGVWIFLILAIVAIYFFWRHEHFKKYAPAKTVVSKTSPKPFTVSRQSSVDFPRAVHDVFEAQVALARRGISPGSLDAAVGSQTRAAILVFQQFQHLPITGKLDALTRSNLMLDAPILATYTVTTNDLARLQSLGKTWIEKSQQSALDYETELELVAEKSHSHPALIRLLNQNVNWTNISAGTVLKIPDVNYPEPNDKAAFVAIHLSEKFLEAFDAQTNLLLHVPCSIAAKVEKRPVGELHVVVVAPNPNYTFDPELFPEAPESKTLDHKLIIPPGPNNPVGVAWIGLDKIGYGIHGTPVPEQVGRTESHGCFRLANWDAEYLVNLVWAGMPVFVEP
ncbi:MAG TPA: L,D-transpeptidase [Methylomirabilota bacterium]|nr:L,D-transpeptidase [Methylomirabilota bacterium]